MRLMVFEINVILTWSSTCVITNSTDVGKFLITVSVVTLSTLDNQKLFEQSKSSSK